MGVGVVAVTSGFRAINLKDHPIALPANLLAGTNPFVFVDLRLPKQTDQFTTMYIFECDLVEDFEGFLSSVDNPFSSAQFAFEFSHSDGRVDVVARTLNGDLIAFEAKLTSWRVAISQAYRNTSFSHYSYVVLPPSTVKNAMKRRHEFERLGIGLCSVGPNGLAIEIPASRKDPFQPWITDTAMRYIARNGTAHVLSSVYCY